MRSAEISMPELVVAIPTNAFQETSNCEPSPSSVTKQKVTDSKTICDTFAFFASVLYQVAFPLELFLSL